MAAAHPGKLCRAPQRTGCMARRRSRIVRTANSIYDTHGYCWSFTGDRGMKVLPLFAALGVCLMGLASAGCGAKSDAKVKIAYIGLTCEAPIFVAYEKGFFQQEG